MSKLIRSAGVLSRRGPAHGRHAHHGGVRHPRKGFVGRCLAADGASAEGGVNGRFCGPSGRWLGGRERPERAGPGRWLTSRCQRGCKETRHADGDAAGSEAGLACRDPPVGSHSFGWASDRNEGASGNRRRPRRPPLGGGPVRAPWASSRRARQAIQPHYPCEWCRRVRLPANQSGWVGCRCAPRGRGPTPSDGTGRPHASSLSLSACPCRSSRSRCRWICVIAPHPVRSCTCCPAAPCSTPGHRRLRRSASISTHQPAGARVACSSAHASSSGR